MGGEDVDPSQHFLGQTKPPLPLTGTHFSVDQHQNDIFQSGYYLDSRLVPCDSTFCSSYFDIKMPSFGEVCQKSLFTRINDTVNDVSFFL